MATCYQKHPFEIETEDRLTTINTKIFDIKKRIQLSEGLRKSHFEENETEKNQNNDLIDTLKKEVKLRLQELSQARLVLGDEEGQLKNYLNGVCPVRNKTSEQIIHNLDLKVIEQRKMLDLLKYDRRSKKNKLKLLEGDYEKLLIESTKSETVKAKSARQSRKKASHLENEIHKVLIQWTEAELIKKKYLSIKLGLIDDSVKFESSLERIEELIKKQRDEITKLEHVREEASVMRLRASAAASTEASRAHDAEHARTVERAHFTQRFQERARELEKLEKRIFPPAPRVVVRQDSTGSTEGGTASDETTAQQQMEDIFQRLMKLTGVNEAEEVYDRFQSQRETSKRLNYLQQTTEEEKLELEQQQTNLMAELEAFKFASVRDKDEGQDQITELKTQIEEEKEVYSKIESELRDLENTLMDIKELLYNLCKLLDVISEPAIPEWTTEARDVQDIVTVLTLRYESAKIKAVHIRETKDPTKLAMPSNPTSGAASMTGVSLYSHSTPKEPDIVVPTYKELVQKEPVKAPPSDEEEDIPSRCYLKRQAQLIVDTKCRRKGFRPPYPKK